MYISSIHILCFKSGHKSGEYKWFLFQVLTTLNWSTLLETIVNSVLQNLCSKSNSHFVPNLKHCAFWLTLEHLTEIWMRLYLVPKCFSSPFIWITNEEHQEIDPKRSFVLECHHPLPATYFIFKTVCYVFLEVKPPYFRQLNIWIIHIYIHGCFIIKNFWRIQEKNSTFKIRFMFANNPRH